MGAGPKHLLERAIAPMLLRLGHELRTETLSLGESFPAEISSAFKLSGMIAETVLPGKTAGFLACSPETAMPRSVVFAVAVGTPQAWSGSMVMPTVKRRLTERPHLDVPRREARELLEACLNGDPDALERIRRRHPKFKGASNDAAIPSWNAPVVRTVRAGSQVDRIESNRRWAKPISADGMLPASTL
jgi:hypothetical protein